MTDKDRSPCLSCTRVACPGDCENKACKEWKQWFLNRWDRIYRFGQIHRQKKEDDK